MNRFEKIKERLRDRIVYATESKPGELNRFLEDQDDIRWLVKWLDRAVSIMKDIDEEAGPNGPDCTVSEVAMESARWFLNELNRKRICGFCGKETSGASFCSSGCYLANEGRNIMSD